MATNIWKLPAVRTACRGLSAQAAHAEAAGPSSELKCTLLPNKILVSTQDLCGGLSRISVVFRTGPRNELHKNAGVTHLVRSLTGFTTAAYTDFFIYRNLQQLGCYLSCTGNREITSFNLIGTRYNIWQAVPLLDSVVSSPAFKPWQVKRNTPRIRYEISLQTPQFEVMEMLHKAAFRTGLGNSMLVAKDKIDEFTYDVLCNFYASSFTSNRACVVGYNVNHREVLKFAESLKLNEGDIPAGNSKFYGGEIRKEKLSDFATVAIAGEGCGSNDLKQFLIYGILEQALGSVPSVMWGNSQSPIFKAVAGNSPTAGVGAFSISYSDSGLFGFMIRCFAQDAGSVVEAAWKVLKSGQLSAADIKRGKALLKVKVLESASNSEHLMEDIAVQSLVNGTVVPATVFAEAIEKISESEVQSAAKKVANGKFALAALGNLGEVPYLDQLK